MRLTFLCFDCNGNLKGIIHGADGEGPLFRIDFLTVGRIAEVLHLLGLFSFQIDFQVLEFTRLVVHVERLQFKTRD